MDKRHKRQIDQLHTVMKNHRLNPDFADVNLELEKKESLPPKYQFPSMKKYSGTDDPHLHLKQYVIYMKPTGLSQA